MRKRYDPENDRNPLYPDLGEGVAKWRRKARAVGGLRKLAPEDRHAYGTAVERAILTKQRSEAHAGLPPANPKARCTSGTFHNDGADIHNAIQQQQRNALLACPGKERRAREPHVWQSMYDDAMNAKREREQTLEAAE